MGFACDAGLEPSFEEGRGGFGRDVVDARQVITKSHGRIDQYAVDVEKNVCDWIV
jgi:hypothetical protein